MSMQIGLTSEWLPTRFQLRAWLISFSVAAVFVGVPSTSGAQSSAAGCQKHVDRAARAFNAKNHGDVLSAYASVKADRLCTGIPTTFVGRYVSLSLLRQALTKVAKQKARLSVVAADLARAAEFGRPWKLLVVLGDLERKERKNYARATALYQEALEDIHNKTYTPDGQAPSGQVIEYIVKLAMQSRLLAKTYVAASNRDGKPIGIGRRSIRGYKVTKVAVPVRFKYDSTSFTVEGRKAAFDLFRFLSAQRQPKITLVGHTDPRGDRAYNKGLSERRAAALKKFLLDQGYRGVILTKGMGEDAPFVPADPGGLSVQQLHQLHRRVELQR